MRLPTLTRRQQQLEDARAFHEAIWSAWLERQTFRVLTDDPKRKQAYLSGSSRKFWNPRGYAFKTKRTDAGLDVWITPLTVSVGKKRTAAA